MSPTHIIIHYVTSPAASAAFYEKLLGHAPVSLSEGFAMLPLSGSIMLGLWKRSGVQPSALAGGSNSEIDIACTDRAELELRLADWRDKGAVVLQEPTVMDFGHSATVADPDGHRLRLFALAA